MIGEVNNRGHQEVSFNNEGDIPGVRKLAVDEISIKKRHKYATVVADAQRYPRAVGG